VLIAPEQSDAVTNFVFSTMAEVEEPYVEPAYEEEAAEPEYVAEEEEFVAEGVATEVKLFGKWAFGDIEVRDISLVVSASNSLFVSQQSSMVSSLVAIINIIIVYVTRTILLARVTMPRICPTRLVDTPRSAFARPPAPLWSASCAA
jgi:hypothetical protein